MDKGRKKDAMRISKQVIGAFSEAFKRRFFDLELKFQLVTQGM